MNDREYIHEFEQCTLPKEKFGHRGHLRIAWIYLSRHTLDQGLPLIINGIQRYAASLGASHIYHETLTRTWIYLVNKAMQGDQATCFDEFITHHDYLFDTSLPLKHYSQTVLFGEIARSQWIEPDLKPLIIN